MTSAETPLGTFIYDRTATDIQLSADKPEELVSIFLPAVGEVFADQF